MAYLLRILEAGGYITIPEVTKGASTFDIELDITPTDWVSGSGYMGVFGNSDGGVSSRHTMLFFNITQCELAMIIGGSRRVIIAPVGTFPTNARRKVNIIYNGSQLRLLVDNAQVGSVAAAGAVGGTRGITDIGAAIGTGVRKSAIDLYSLKFTVDGVLARNYNPPASGGTGNILPETISGLNGTQTGTWPADNSEWIFYNSGDYSLNADGGTFAYSGAAASTLLNRRLSADGRSFSYSGASSALRLNRLLTASGSTFSYAGASADLLLNRRLSADGASFTYSGAAATLTYTQITGFVLNADGGSFSIAGGEVEFIYVQNLPEANASDFTVSAIVDSSFSFESRISPSVGFSAMISSTFQFNGSLN